jgi:hypothetical protein
MEKPLKFTRDRIIKPPEKPNKKLFDVNLLKTSSDESSSESEIEKEKEPEQKVNINE